jgi:hypothetical protein
VFVRVAVMAAPGAVDAGGGSVEALEVELDVTCAMLGAPDCTYVSELETVSRWVADASCGVLSPACVRYLLATALPRALDALLGRDFGMEGVAERALESVLRPLAALLARSLVTATLCDPAAALLRRLLNPRLHFFSRLGHPPGTVVEAGAGGSEGWRRTVTFADHVDAMLLFDDGSTRWHRAQIVEESELQFRLHFANQSDACEKWVDKDSPEIAPAGSKVVPEEVDAAWAGALREGDMLDVRDDVSFKWYNATVQAHRSSLMMYREICVVYRIYMSNGEHEDDRTGRRYRGYPNKASEWIGVEARQGRARLAKLGTRAVAPQAVVTEAPVNDANDPAGVYAVGAGAVPRRVCARVRARARVRR